MSNISYNPNVDIPPYHGFSDNNGPKVMDFPSDGNFRSGGQHTSYDINNSGDFRYDQVDNRDVPRREYRMERVEHRDDYHLPARIDMQYNQNTERFNQPKKKHRIESMSDQSQRFNWILFAKKIVIFTVLFLIFNHMKTHNLFCGLLPFLNNNDLLCITVKGFVFSLIILLLLGTFLK